MKEINITDLDGQAHSIDLDHIGNQAFCMDCMELMRALPDKAFQLAICDPPYGIGANKMTLGNGKTKIFRGSDDWDKCAPPFEYFKELQRVSVNQIIWGANHFISKMPYDSSCWIVWDKDNGETDFADCELAWTSFNSAVRKFKWKWQGMLQENMKNKQERIHPNEKPIELYEFLIRTYAKPNDKILDTHLGSGSSRIAADKANLPFVGCELDPDYFYASAKRFKEYAAQQTMF